MVEMKMWKKGFLLLTVLAVGLTAGCGGTQQTGAKKNVKVGVVQLVEHQALDAANKGFVDGLSAPCPLLAKTCITSICLTICPAR